MDAQQLQNDKLNIINWITQLQDYALVEKIKSLMSSSNEFYTLTTEQQETLDSQIGLDPKLYTDADKLYADLKSKYEL
ncbi:hypothetical protein E0I26_11805 [Flavobacterium rhamnosiphilum]|uniref:Addiction module component n=1 Tax=Flavobacterium rhamnosiphilum TaxID=2541724 RepID=A0A4R5F6K0_9FLAO|nr:hypothetical protein [Flavobacterium rhamnosiphilum]TDE43289.1 hypothetical protein E0I26_11805 [Flavobacterium rhamnosiphilum]